MTTPAQPFIPERYHPYLWILAGIAVVLAILAMHHSAPSAPDYAGYSHPDATYLRALDGAGITYSTPAAAIDTGKLIGSQYDSGSSMSLLKVQFHRSAAVAARTTGVMYSTWQLDRMVEAGIASYAARTYSTK